MPSFCKQIVNHYNASFPALMLVTHEEQRAKHDLISAVRKINGLKPGDEIPGDGLECGGLIEWSITRGLQQAWPEPTAVDGSVSPIDAVEKACSMQPNGEGESGNLLFVFNDMHPYWDDPELVRQTRDTIAVLKMIGGMMVFISPVLKLPHEIEKEVVVIDYSLPDRECLGQILDEFCKSNEISEDEDEKEHILDAASGLTSFETENVLALSLVEEGKLDTQVITRHKAQAIKKSGLLELMEPQETMEDVGGLELFKKWLKIRQKAFMPEAREFGLPAPRGILMLGVPGCGKSLSAKAAASLWGLPLIRCDVGAVFGSLVGESERNMRTVIETAEAVAPCILFLDEIDKGFAGVGGGGDHDGGTSRRVFGTFLTWMQERKKPVFVIATANDISCLPPELLRKGGRFDEIFFIDLPNAAERKEICRIHIEKFRDPGRFNLGKLSDLSEGFTGGDIQEAITQGMFFAFDEGKELGQKFLERGFKEIVPLSKTMGDRIEVLREWGENRAKRASIPEGSKRVNGKMGRRRVR